MIKQGKYDNEFKFQVYEPKKEVGLKEAVKHLGIIIAKLEYWAGGGVSNGTLVPENSDILFKGALSIKIEI